MKVLKSEIPSGDVTTYIVVDALDEFSLDDPPSALALIHDLEELNVRLLITCRYNISFLRRTSMIEVSASTEDIQTFIEKRISSCPRLKDLIARSSGLRSEILKEVTAKSQGM